MASNSNNNKRSRTSFLEGATSWVKGFFIPSSDHADPTVGKLDKDQVEEEGRPAKRAKIMPTIQKNGDDDPTTESWTAVAATINNPMEAAPAVMSTPTKTPLNKAAAYAKKKKASEMTTPITLDADDEHVISTGDDSAKASPSAPITAKTKSTKGGKKRTAGKVKKKLSTKPKATPTAAAAAAATSSNDENESEEEEEAKEKTTTKSLSEQLQELERIKDTIPKKEYTKRKRQLRLLKQLEGFGTKGKKGLALSTFDAAAEVAAPTKTKGDDDEAEEEVQALTSSNYEGFHDDRDTKDRKFLYVTVPPGPLGVKLLCDMSIAAVRLDSKNVDRLFPGDILVSIRYQPVKTLEEAVGVLHDTAHKKRVLGISRPSSPP